MLENMYILHTFDRRKSLKDSGHITRNQYFFSWDVLLQADKLCGCSSNSCKNGVVMGQCRKVDVIVFASF